MKNLILKVVFLNLIWFVVVACGCGFDLGGDNGPAKYNITDFTTYSVKETNTSGGPYFDAFATHLEDGSELKWSELGVFINIEKEFISQAKVNSLFSNAFACSPEAPMALQKISESTITSDHVFQTPSKTFVAGESLNELFDVDEMADFTIADAFISNEHPEPILLTLNTAPVSGQPHRFHINITLDNGDTFEVTTVLVHLKL